MADATNTTAGSIVLGGDLFGDDANSPVLVASGVIPGTYSVLARTYVDSKGRTVQAGAMSSSELVGYVATANYVQRGITRPGYNINIASSVLSVNTASSTVKGIFTVSSPLVNNAGTIEVDTNALPVASTIAKGVVQVGSGLYINSGVLSRTGGDATTSSKGIAQVGTGFNITSGVLDLAYGNATSSAKGLVQIDTTYLNLTGSTISIPVTSSSVKGIVKPGSGFDVTAGVLTPSSGLATASTPGYFSFSNEFENTAGTMAIAVTNYSRTGYMRVGAGLSESAGVVSRVVDDATSTSKGIIQVGSGLSVSSGVMSYAAPDATGGSKGLVQIGSGLSVTSGVLSRVLPFASASEKGIMQVGIGLSDSAGVVSLMTPPDGTASTKGIVSIDTAQYLGIASGVLSYTVPDATSGSKGQIRINTNAGLALNAGVLSVALPDASTIVKGIAQIGSGLAVTSGVVSVTATQTDTTAISKGVAQFDATYFNASSGLISLKSASGNTVFGVVQPTNSNNLTATSGDLDIGANIAKFDSVNTYTAANTVALKTDTYSAIYAPDFSQSNTYEMVLTGNVSLAAPTNAVPGGVYTIILTQDGVGSRTFAFSGTGYKANQSITLSTLPNSRDILTLIYKSSTEIFVLFTPGF